MKSQNSASSLAHPAVLGLSRRRMAYSALVLSLATLCVLLISLSFSIREFRATQSLRIAPQRWGEVSLEEVRDQTLEIVKSSTSEESLRACVSAWQAATPGPSSAKLVNPDQIDYDKLRGRLQFAVEGDRNERFIDLRLEYAGRASVAERELLKVFAAGIARRLSDLGTLSNQEIVKLKFDTSELEPARRLRNRLTSEMQSQLVQLEESLLQVSALLESDSSQSESEVQASGGIVVNPKMNQLKSLLNELLAKRDELLGQFPGSHPDVISVRQEIEQVSLELKDLQEIASRSIQNSFVQASYGTNRNSVALAPLKEMISKIDLTPLRSSLTSMSDHYSRAIGQMERRAVELSGALNSGPTLQVEAMSGSVRAVGSINSTTVLWAIFASTLFGCVVASRLDVWTLDRGFSSKQVASQELHVPVFTLENPTAAGNRLTPPSVSQRILKLSEIILFTTLLVIGGMMLIDSEFRGAVFENPLHLFARLFWMIRG